LEVTPPREPRPQVLLRRAALLGPAADAINVIQRTNRVSSLEASLELLTAGYEPVWHLLNRGRSADEIEHEIGRAEAAGIPAVLCIRGEHDEADKSDTPKIRQVVERVRAAMPSALIGVTLNPYAPREPALRNLLPKLAAGAEYVQTNPVFELGQLAPVAEELKSRAPGVRIVPMAMPLLTRESADRLQQRIGVPAPPALGWSAFRELLHALCESPLVDGVAIMTLQMDAPRGTGERIREALGAQALA
jgi:5,10-methylenetetrahydrofolate reductase